MDVVYATGRRKRAIARVYVKDGKGKIQINNKDYQVYFPLLEQQQKINQPFKVTDTLNKLNIRVNVNGGGITGQTEAVRLAIARALCKIDPTHRPSLKEQRLLTRDSRVVERKKYGRPKARKRFQFSKR